MKNVKVRIIGESPLLHDRFTEEAELALGKTTRSAITAASDKLPREVASRSAYFHAIEPHGDEPGARYYYLPGTGFARLMREAGSNHKMKGTRKSVKSIVPAAIFVVEDHVRLYRPDFAALIPEGGFEVDSRPVTNPTTKGRVMKHRPRFDSWGAELHLQVDETLLQPGFAQQLLAEGGQRLGVGNYRPERGGPFGRFRVVLFDQYEREPLAPGGRAA